MLQGYDGHYTAIDNKTRLLGDDLREELSLGGKVRIAASVFSIYAFDALKEELEKVDELRFLFTQPAFVDKQISENIHKEKREFYLSRSIAESSICGTEFEIKLRNKLTQKAIARECADWIREKVKFESPSEPMRKIGGMINVETREGAVHYNSVDGFTTDDLGYENSGSYLTIVTKLYGGMAKGMLKEFDSLWNDGRMTDVTDAVVDYISGCYTENSPEYIYFLILYHIFSDFLDDINEDNMPNEATGFKNSIIWNTLYNFQKDGAVGAINKLEKYNGCILADSVGLGKTFTALAVMQYYSLRNKSILVLCPKRLEENWNQYIGNKTTNPFYNDRIRFDLFFHTDLGRENGKSRGTSLSQVNWGNYDLVVIDESHNFRNNNTAHRDKDTRYDFLMKRIMKDGVKTKVLMLSATPVNNRYNDLKNQLLLAYGGDMEEMGRTIGTEKSIQSIFTNAQKNFNAWSKLPASERHAKDLIDRLDIDFSIILDRVTIARSRKHIRTFYDTKDIGKFPDRLPTKSYYPELTDMKSFIGYKGIYELLRKTTMNVYAPLAMIFPSKTDKYEKKYKLDLNKSSTAASYLGEGFTQQRNRENGLKRLMTISLLKRLESSAHAFRITLKNLIDTNTEILDKIDRFLAGDKSVTIQKEISSFSYEDEDPDDSDLEYSFADKGDGKIIDIELSDMDVKSWKRDIENDVQILQTIYAEMTRITPDRDNKLATLKSIIDEKIAHPINGSNKKILIFSAFADTTEYLYEQIAPYMLSKYGLSTAMVSGANHNKSNVPGPQHTDRLLTLFSPESKNQKKTYPNEKRMIDVMIGTDCISEGQNLQDCDICINYDIHWNPVRIIQRFGRIDRIGSINDKIQLVNFWPCVSLDEYINLTARVYSRMTIVNATATADENILSEEENDELDYRKEQLKHLQEGTLQDLEDVDGTISITDLGLNDFVMDLAAYHKKNGDPKGVIKGLHAVAAADPSKGIERGVIFVLYNRNNGVNINKQNRLHPYYLVYVKENGEILHDHLDVKAILDVLRSACKNRTEPIAALCKSFNRETKDGSKMQAYSDLLGEAVASIMHVSEESDLDLLFRSGSQILTQRRIEGLDDFELIAFVVFR
ncbi:MAG: SNF2-related protein [Clostridia bacterium]|nr:SNF2-related protein [Clostridia bacterium]